MLGKVSLYWNTVRYMKPSQIYYRLGKMMHLPSTLGVLPGKAYMEAAPVQTIPELDFDPVFLARFPVEETMADQVTLLHETEKFHWNTAWNFPERTPLWNYNLHYFEYLFPLVKVYRDTGSQKYLDKIKNIICAWIEQNQRKSSGVGWDPYPTALRLTNWLSLYAHLEKELSENGEFHKMFIHSVWEQYDCLAHHLEKDLLGNHYFEDLKALILCALFFKDERMFEKALAEFRRQCREQILPDGMHFELSPMYHKIIFEDMMRVAVALRGAGRADAEVESYLQSMLDVVYSLEEGLDRIPLFNDCGNNVAKSLDALCVAAKGHFNLTPVYRDKFPDSGYYIFKQGNWKLIVDAGQPGPSYLPGHAHCDAMSFELFRAGKPVIVNCGTYAYQCEERAFFRSTAAHNTVQVDRVEQSQCWGAFRMGKRIKIEKVIIDENSICMRIVDQRNNLLQRYVSINDRRVKIVDTTSQKGIHSYFHDVRVNHKEKTSNSSFFCARSKDKKMKFELYAPEFGKTIQIIAIEVIGEGKIEVDIRL